MSVERKDKETKRHHREFSERIPTVLKRSKLFWVALPDWMKAQYSRALKQAAYLISKKITEELRSSKDKNLIDLFVYGSFLDRIRTIKEFDTRLNTNRIGNPLSTLHTTGFWLDELYFPEETIWLSMTVPKRVWWWLVIDPVKRARFLAFVKELFPDEIPRIEGGNDVSGSSDAE